MFGMGSCVSFLLFINLVDKLFVVLFIYKEGLLIYIYSFLRGGFFNSFCFFIFFKEFIL